MDYAAVIEFWFDELGPRDHFKKSARLDEDIRKRFGNAHAAATRGELFRWRETPAGRLAEIIVLDQFSRNLHRGDARAFANDGMALVLAQEAVRAGADQEMPPAKRAFFYLPYEHSESPVIHEIAVKLFSRPGLEQNLEFEYKHLDLIQRFGRYPHRNAALGRASTPAEEAYLDEPGAGF
jgi:uncharacterized protein (DUF924 family)